MKNAETNQTHPLNRQPSAAGAFYPGNPELLRLELKEAFEKAAPCVPEGDVLAIVCPHAGYMYSAKVAASAYNQINPLKTYEHIFVIGSSHRMSFDGASIYTVGDYFTPLGRVRSDKIGRELIIHHAVFTDDPKPHQDEHTIEVQIPFLQWLIHKPFSIVPIVIGTQSLDTCKKIANALTPYLNSRNLFIISTDFSHYPPYKQSRQIDSTLADAVITNHPENFLYVLHNEEQKKDVPHLVTAMCGWTSVLTMLYMTSTIPHLIIRKVDAQNSGDVEQGDTSRVVGYVALSVEQKNSPVDLLTDRDKQDLLNLTHECINTYVKTGVNPRVDASAFSENACQHGGAFVTLTSGGKLRGCVGRLMTKKPLYQTIHDMAIAAATSDFRFCPVTINELNILQIEISVLTPMHKISSIEEITLGKHGILIQKGRKKGTLLPQVAIERNWTVEEFLGYCSRDKADLGWNGWKEADIYVYEALVFGQ
jgi:AmmeMemoRadiSam system protein B/AmmeMemoRadiSam system protein A